MKQSFLEHRGFQTVSDLEEVVYYDSSTNPWTKKSMTVDRSYVTQRTSWVDQLKCGATIRGDRHSPNPFWFKKTEQVHLSGSYSQTMYKNNVDSSQGIRRIMYDGPIGSAITTTLPIPYDQAFNKALGRLNEKLRGAVDLSVDLAQAGQVKNMVRNASALGSYTRGFSRRTLANKWLEFTYGWRPLAQTLYGSVEQLYDRAHAPIRCVAKATVKDKRAKVDSIDIWNKSQVDEVSCRVLLSFDYIAASPRTDQLSRLTSLNPISIAWELVPYSFVVDWVYDIGSFLRDTESYLVASTGTISSGYQTTTSIETSKATWIGRGQVLNGWKTIGSVSGSTVIKSFSRQLLPFWPLPRPPVFQADLGASRLISAASLLAQHLGVPPREGQPKRTISTTKWSNFKRKHDAAERRSATKFRKR